MLLARELTAHAPDPLAIARRLEATGARAVALLHAGDTGAVALAVPSRRWSFVAGDPDRRSTRLDPLSDDPDFRRAPATSALAHVPRWIGVIPYDGRRPALERPGWASRPRSPSRDTRSPARLTDPEWHRYPAVACVDHLHGRVLVAGTSRAAIDHLIARIARPAPPSPELSISAGDDEPPARHAERIAAAKELIAQGDLYQVNLARRLWIRLRKGDPLTFYTSMAKQAPTPLGAYLRLDRDTAVVATSPELLLHAKTRVDSTAFGALFTIPIKGTRPRGDDATSDARHARELDADPKERAELTMIVDVERHDLGRVAEVGSVRLAAGPAVTTHRTIHHRAALLVARARPDVSREAVIASMVPSGSVTGAPKVRAMEVIASLEPARRGLYTGGLGHVAHDGSVTLAMAIRTAVLEGRDGEYWTGGGIVADSDPAREVEETRWKALQLQRLSGM